MKIALVSAHYAPVFGGVESHVEEIAKRLASRGESVEVLTHHDNAGLPDLEERDGVVVRRYHVPMASQHFGVSPSVWAFLARHRHRYDIVHAHGYHSSAPLTASLARVAPLVFTPHYHGTGHSRFRKLVHIPYRLVGARIISRSARIICVSRAEANLFLKHFPSAGERTRIIPNGADLERIKQAQPLETLSKVIVTGGRLQSYKQVDRIIDAMTMMPEGFRLVVTGDGPERDRLESLASQLRVSDQVSFIGQVDIDALYRWYASADVFCSMSTNEAMPVTMLELMAAGARIVASDIPAHRDVRERTAGPISLVPCDAGREVIAAALQRAYTSQVESHQRIPTWDEVTTETMEVYRELVKAAS
jgi:glycosyltransferase involved in cell wall biosynthesis